MVVWQEHCFRVVARSHLAGLSFSLINHISAPFIPFEYHRPPSQEATLENLPVEFIQENLSSLPDSRLLQSVMLTSRQILWEFKTRHWSILLSVLEKYIPRELWFDAEAGTLGLSDLET